MVRRKMLRSVVVFAALVVGVVGFSGAAADAGTNANPNCPTLLPNGALSKAPSPGADWSGCDLQGAFMYQANLSNVNLSGANLQGASLVNSTGQETDLAGANLSGADLDGVTFSHANLTGANLESAYANGGVPFRLSNSDLTGANISDANFSGADFAQLKSGNLTASGGSPTLPAGWTSDNGYLLGPGVDFSQDDFPALGTNVPDLASQDLSNSTFAGANLTGVDLSNDNLANGQFAVANLTNANLDGDNLTDADLEMSNLTNANLDGADLTGVMWSANTTCPDGTSSGAHGSTCANNIDDRPPAAKPSINGTGAKGWYAKVTVNWNWTDANGTIDPAHCVTSTASATEGKAVKLTATCGNTAGAVGQAAVSVNIENKGPAVTVTGPAAGRLYASGHVPAPGCRTTDALSGVAKAAKVSVTSNGWSRGVGSLTATCAGAVNQAGIGQAAPVRVKYTVAYGLPGFVTPKNRATVARSAHRIPVTFRLAGIPAKLAAKFAAAGDIRVTLSGPGIPTLTAAATWDPKPGLFAARLLIPAKVKTGQNYLITVRESVGTGWLTAPVTGTAVNPETIRFR
jgi:uncharacterized protein YjbI with pentapeptide repeats